MKKLIALLLITATLGCSLATFGKSVPIDLLACGSKEPMAVDRDAVTFSWALNGSGRGEAQSAYQIVVGSSEKLVAEGRGDYWDSGKVASQNSAGIAYAGRPLPPAARCWWKVRVWDQNGIVGPFSRPTMFDTGLAPGGWRARYIWDGTTNLNNFAYFRKAFFLPRKPALAKIYVTAHNDYLLCVNGRAIGMGPARSNPYGYGQYNGYDITPLLERGTNAFAAIGHWQGNWKDSGVNAEPAFIAEAHLMFEDGHTEIVATDSSWRTLASTAFIETNAVYFGGAGGVRNRAAIQFDARLEPLRWTAAGFDDSRWASATEVNRSSFVLFAQAAALNGEQAEIRPLSIKQRGNASLVDFGRCIDGWPKLTMRANQPGDRIRVEYFQMAGEKFGSGWDEYVCRGGVETWKPAIGRHASFQVLKVTGYAGELRKSDVRGIWAYDGADLVGRFRCSSELLNSIYQMCERSARQNVQQGIISVDANREQSPWTADSWNIGNVLLYNHRNTRIIDKIVRDYASEQLPCGDFHACSPAAMFRIPEWSMYWPMLLWQEYLFSGDEQLLRAMAPKLNAFLNWMKTFQDNETKLINPPDGSWEVGIRVSEYAGGKMPSGGYNIATACQYYENLRIASRLYSVLGDTEAAEKYRQQAEEVKDGINKHLFNGEFYLARSDRKEMFPLASAWPLRFDLVPDRWKPRVVAAIRRVGKPHIGGYGGDAFYSGLLNAATMGDFLVEDLARYRPMLDSNGANWESFERGHEVNHAWTAYPGYLFQKYISGIQPTSGGFSTFDVRPDTSGLDLAESTVPTVKGLIRTRWEKTPGKLVLFVTVPANSRATVHMPKPAEPFSIEESGVVLLPSGQPRNSPGILEIKDGPNTVAVTVASGTYNFSVRSKPHSKAAAGPVPLRRAHSHNDYQHERPLLDALDHGFCSIEADIHLVNGQLLVAHDRKDCRSNRTLEALYLEPLRQRIRQNNGRVYKDGPTVTLWIDIKLNGAIVGKDPAKAQAESEKIYALLVETLNRFSKMLTKFSDTKMEAGAVSVVITGAVPKSLLNATGVRLATAEGPVSSLDSGLSAKSALYVCENWPRYFKWRGEGVMPADEQSKLREIVMRTHQQGRRIRWWGAPDKPSIWRELLAADADLIGADDLDALQRFLLSSDTK